jgi:hypothetical protein
MAFVCTRRGPQEFENFKEKKMDNLPPYPSQNPPAQPGYPQPGGFAQPTQPAFPPQQPGQPGNFPQPGFQPPAPVKRRRTGLWVTLIIILLLLIAGGGFFTYLQVRSTPQKTLQAYCTALKNDDAQALYNTYSSAAQARVSLDTLKTELRLVTVLVGGVKDCVVQNDSIQENGSTATGMVTLTLGRGGSGNTTMNLIYENGQWKVQNNAQIPGTRNTP